MYNLVLYATLTISRFMTAGAEVLRWLVVVMLLLCLGKLFLNRGNYLVFLLLIELLMLMSYVMIARVSSSLGSTRLSLFMLICLMVAGACLGIAALVAISRSFSVEIEIFFMKL